MKPEMSNAEAITRIDRFLSYLEEIWTPQCDCEEALIRRDDITAFVIARDALKEQRPHGEWIMHKNFDGYLRFYECSNCNHTQGYLTDFCDTCGADMRKEGE